MAFFIRTLLLLLLTFHLFESNSGSTIYASTIGGLSISTDGGSTWANKTTSNGLGSNTVYAVHIADSTIYAATVGGLSSGT